MRNLSELQAELRERQLAGWLFHDHHHRDAIAYRVLGLREDTMVTRRWYCYVPALGAPRKLVHRIEGGVLAGVAGEERVYSRWSELEAGLRWLLEGGGEGRVAMQYVPRCGLPAISLADAGTVEQVRELGWEVVSSGDLISRFDAAWTEGMLASHRAAGRAVDEAIAAAFALVRQRLDARRALTEYELQQWIAARLRAAGMVVEEAPIVAVNAHAGDPHYLPEAEGSAAIGAGDLLLLDVWAKAEGEETAYYDVTWMGYCLRAGESAPPAEYEATFAVARAARDAGIDLAQAAVGAGRELRGYEVDQAVRGVIERAGLGEYFIHRTGHSLGREVHATGANMDDYETHDTRRVLAHTAFTIEPGIYLPHGRAYGVRTEVNVHVGEGAAEVTGPRQREIVRI